MLNLKYLVSNYEKFDNRGKGFIFSNLCLETDVIKQC